DGQAGGEQEWTENPRELLENTEEPEELSRPMRRNHTREERPTQRLRSPLHHAHQPRQEKEVQRTGHEIPENADPDIGGQTDEDRRFGPDLPRQAPEQKSTGDPDELHDQNRADQGILSDPDIDAIRGRHLDDGLNAIIIDQKSEEHEEGL